MKTVFISVEGYNKRLRIPRSSLITYGHAGISDHQAAKLKRAGVPWRVLDYDYRYKSFLVWCSTIM